MAAPPTFVLYRDIDTIGGSWDNDVPPLSGNPIDITGVAVQEGDLIVVAGGTGDTPGINPISCTDSAGNVYTDDAEQTPAAGSLCGGAIYCARAGTTATITVTVHFNNASQVGGAGLWVWRDSDGIGTRIGAASATATAPSLAITTCAANSALCMFNLDWTAADGTSRTYRTINGSTGTEDRYHRTAGAYGIYAMHYLDAGAQGSKTGGMTAPATQNWTLLLCEVLGSGTGLNSHVDHNATGARSAGGTTTVAPAYPNGIAANHLAVASRTIKPSTATGSAEAGWTQQVSATGGTGTTGIDVGQTRIVVDTKILVGSESGSVTFDNANSPNSSNGVIQIYRPTQPGQIWDIAVSSGDDNTHGTGRSATSAAALDIAPGDLILAICASDTDTATAYTSPSITASGITFAPTVERLGAGGVTTGNDTGLMVYEARVIAGSATVTVSLSLSGGPSQCGPVAFLRLRSSRSAHHLGRLARGPAVPRTASFAC